MHRIIRILTLARVGAHDQALPAQFLCQVKSQIDRLYPGNARQGQLFIVAQPAYAIAIVVYEVRLNALCEHSVPYLGPPPLHDHAITGVIASHLEAERMQADQVDQMLGQF